MPQPECYRLLFQVQIDTPLKYFQLRKVKILNSPACLKAITTFTLHFHIKLLFFKVLPMCVCSVAQSCPTLWNSMDYSSPVFSVPGILHARILEWVAIPFSRGSSWFRDQTCVSCTARRFFTVWATREAPYICIYTYHVYRYIFTKCT